MDILIDYGTSWHFLLYLIADNFGIFKDTFRLYLRSILAYWHNSSENESYSTRESNWVSPAKTPTALQTTPPELYEFMVLSVKQKI